MKYLRVAVLALVASLAAASMTPARADIGASVSISFFYDSLAPHGEWISSAQFGYVWRPVRVVSDWRPYYDGSWVYTDFGWTFVSDDPWGWATDHYGRWYLDPYYGWVWVPGYEWAPAWVVFQQGGGYVGWAPLPPNVSLSLAIGGGYRVDPRAYCFVEERHFVDRRVRRHVVSPERNVHLVRSTANATHFSRSGERYFNRSLSTERIERAARQRIERRRVVDVSDHRGERLRLESDRVAIFRPQVSRRATHPPRDVVRRDDSRSGRIDRDRDSKRESPARLERRTDAPKAPARSTSERHERSDRLRVDSSRGSTRERAAIDSRRPVSPERPAIAPGRSTTRERTEVDARRPTSRERPAIAPGRSTTRERTEVSSKRPTSRERTAITPGRSTTRQRTEVDARRPTSRERTAIAPGRSTTRERTEVSSKRPTSREPAAVESPGKSSKEKVEASSERKARSKGKKPVTKRDPKREQGDEKPPRGSGRGG
jgi:hypothetical protein